MQKDKIIIALINIGSPNQLTLKAVKSYLRSFLMDPYVIQIPFFLRYILFYLLICSIRASKTLSKYKSIWQREGSPFHVFTENFRKKLENKLGIKVINLMMYSEPSFDSAFSFLCENKYTKIIVAPMYPQYADSSYLASVEKFKKYFKKSNLTSEVHYLDVFYKENYFIDSFYTNIINQYPNYKKFDHIVFSYHGLPQSHIDKSNPLQNYQEQCFETTRLLATKLSLTSNSYLTCFQSRVGITKWITPYLDRTCEELAKKNLNNILVISPSFVVDGLETLQEISDLEKSLNVTYPSLKLNLVKALNSEEVWVNNFSEFIVKYLNH